MLRAAAMPLQRNLGARLYHQTFRLEALSLVERLEISPGAVDAAMRQVLVAMTRLQVLHRKLHILREVLVRYQDRVIGLDDHQVLYTDSRHQATLGAHITTSRSIEIDIAA